MHFPSGINCPPYETADGFLQTTRGCSHNHCLFCTYFKDQKFCKSPIEEIESDIKEITAYFGAPKRIFLQGADGFAADYDVLMKTAELLHKYVPSVESIGGYARIDNFYDKTEEQLRNLASVGYSNPYIGVESGEMEKMEEIHELVRCLTNDTVFMNEHASNLFHVECRIPEKKDELLSYISKFMESHDETQFRKYREQITRAFL